MANFGRTTIGTTGQSLSTCVYVELDNFPENGALASISFYSSAGAGDARLALYAGGSAGDPNGATLVEDLGVLTGLVIPGWNTKSSTTTPALTSGTKYWIGLKSNDTCNSVYNSTDDGNLTGQRVITTGESGDETNEWDITVPGAGTAALRYVSAYLTYTTGGDITNVDGDDVVLNGQASVVINTTGITTGLATVNLKTSDDSTTAAQAVASTTASSITLSSVALGDNPFTAAGRQLQIEVNDGTPIIQNVTVNPATGKSMIVVDTTPVVALVGGYVTSIFYGYTGTAPAIGDQIEFDTLDSLGNAVTMSNNAAGVDGSFSVAGEDTTSTFSVRWWNPTDFWSNEVGITVIDQAVVSQEIGIVGNTRRKSNVSKHLGVRKEWRKY